MLNGTFPSMKDPIEPIGPFVEQGTIQFRSRAKGIRIQPKVKSKQEIPAAYLTVVNMKKVSAFSSGSHTKILQPSPHARK